MKKTIFVFLTVATLLVSPAFIVSPQQHGTEKPKEGQGAGGGMMGGGMMEGGMGMMCPMMGGMIGGMGGGMSDPKMMGRMMEMRGEMMMKMGEVMMKHGKMMQKEGAKPEPKKSM